MNQLYEAKQALERRHGKGTAAGLNDLFRRFANAVARAMGSKWAFVGAMALILLWAASYPIFKKLPDGFNTWQLVINTLTTVITFLMVFLIQATQNRDNKAIHLKLDELLRGVEGARTHLVDLENLSDEELERLEREFKRLHEREVRKSPHENHTASRQAGEGDSGAN